MERCVADRQWWQENIIKTNQRILIPEINSEIAITIRLRDVEKGNFMRARAWVYVCVLERDKQRQEQTHAQKAYRITYRQMYR